MKKKAMLFLAYLITLGLLFTLGTAAAQSSKERQGSCDTEKIVEILKKAKYDVIEVKPAVTGLLLSLIYMKTDSTLKIVFFFHKGKLVTFQSLSPAHPIVDLDRAFMDGLFKVLMTFKKEKCKELHPVSFDKNAILKSLSPGGIQWDDNPAADTVRKAVKLLEEGRESEALNMLEEALKKDPANVLLKRQMGSSYFYAGEKNKSMELIKKAVELWEELFREKKIIPNLLAELHAAYTRLDALAPEAGFMKNFEERAKKDPGDIIAVFFTGVDLFSANKYEESISWLEKLLPTLEQESRVYLYLAMNNFKLKRQAEGEKLIARAIELNPEDPDVYFCRSLIVREKDRNLAIEDLKRYIKFAELPGRFPQKEKLEWIKNELEALKRGENPKSWDER